MDSNRSPHSERLLVQLFTSSRHVDLAGVVGKTLNEKRGIIPASALASTLRGTASMRKARPQFVFEWSSTIWSCSLDTPRPWCRSCQEPATSLAPQARNEITSNWQLQTWGVIASRTKRNRGIDFTSKKRVFDGPQIKHGKVCGKGAALTTAAQQVHCSVQAVSDKDTASSRCRVQTAVECPSLA